MGHTIPSGVRRWLLQLIAVLLLAACADTTAPPFPEHRVQKGETLYGIAKTYRISLRTLLDINRLRPPYHLRIGQKLRIPPSIVHQVRPGEGLWGIAKRHHVSLHALVQLNNLTAPWIIHPGQLLRLPNTHSAIVPPSTPSQSVRTTAARQPDPSNATPPSARLDATPSAQGFLWPVEGRVVQAFSQKNPELGEDGITILANDRTPVRAANSGSVVYAGNRMSRYNHVVLIRHPHNLVSVYAHLSSIQVRRGQSVRRGQIIGATGAPANTRTSAIMFQIRKGTDALDPMRFLPPPAH